MVTNTGTGPVNFGQIAFSGKNANEFTVYQNGCGTSLAPDANCEISVQFTPSGTGLRSAAMQIPGDAPNLPQTVSLIGAGQAASEILYVSTLNLDLGSQNINGGTNNATLSLQSNGTAAVSLSALQITGTNAAEFAIANTTCGNILSQTCTISISFSPMGIGPRTANLTIASNVSGSPLTISLSGVGQPDTFALTLSQVTADFGLAALNTQNTATISLTNQGSAGVNFGLPEITGPNASDFVVAANTCVTLAVLPPVDYQDNACAITVAFSPSAVGERNATLQIIDNSPSSPQTVNLYGTGQVIQRSLSASAVTLDFGGQDIGTAASSLPLQITNTGTGPVNIGAIKITGTNAADFAIDPLTNATCGTATLPGSTCTVYVSFTPSVNGPETATLTVTSDASTGPILVSLLGEGQKVVTQLNASESKLDLGIQTIGSTGPVGSFTITNNGDTVVTFYPSSMTGAGAGSFVVTQNTCTATLAPGGVCSMSAAFAPSTTGVSVAALNINSTASPITVWLTGTGIVQ